MINTFEKLCRTVFQTIKEQFPLVCHARTAHRKSSQQYC